MRSGAPSGRGPAAMAAPRPAAEAQRGVSLAVTLFMLVVMMLLGISSARIALQESKASRSDRDRQAAFEAAQEALRDAELDIDGPDRPDSRSGMFEPAMLEGFREGCAAGETPRYAGLCLPAPDGTPAWQTTDLADGDALTARSVPYGRFTGRRLPAPARPPRYIIEPLVFNRPGEAADLPGKTYFYLITAIGFGTRDSTRVVLQSLYRKED